MDDDERERREGIKRVLQALEDAGGPEGLGERTVKPPNFTAAQRRGAFDRILKAAERAKDGGDAGGDKRGGGDKLLYCSFCGKTQHEVKKLVAGPSAFICNECVLLCVEIMWGKEVKGFVSQRPPIWTPPGEEGS